MKLHPAQRLADMAKLIGAEYVGDPDFVVSGINEIHVVEPGDLVFVDHPKYYDKALQSAATIILINKKVECPEGKALLISEDPFRDFNWLNRHFRPFQSASAQISETAQIGEGTIIQPGAFIGNHVTIGKNCVIHSNVSIYDHAVIGDEVVIHANTVLGADAFYYQKRANGYQHMFTCGRVLIEDRVHIGASCTIDRGVTGDTTIGAGTKIDNLVQIGHDTVVGKNCLFASQVGIAGCVVVEDDVTLWGQVGVISGITIGQGAAVFAQSGISKTLEGGKTYFGSPAEEARKMMKELAGIRQIPTVIKQVSNLQRQVDHSKG